MFKKYHYILLLVTVFQFFSCSENSTEPKDEGTVTDIDKNVYKTVKIGDQWWMAENLKVTHYRNGDVIPTVTDDSTWTVLTEGAYCAYGNDNGNVDTYGLLYNWYTVDDSRRIAPEGWHVPSDEEWKQLEMYLGLSQNEANSTGMRGTDEGGKLKMEGTEYWNNPNIGANNSIGFSALPGGYRTSDGRFDSKGQFAFFWTSIQPDSNTSWYRVLYYNSSDIRRFSNNNLRGCGYSVRCVKD
jgi:uncharacterized protein (TIGR02145 family)